MKHILFVLLSLFLLLGIPALFWGDWSAVFPGGDGVDAVSGASLDVPDQPSGNFYIFMNTKYRHETLSEWRDFFEERPVGVIFEDISCLVPAFDAAGIQLAERYQARLAENQMSFRTEETTLLTSKIEAGVFDVVILSREAAEALKLQKVFTDGSVMTVLIEGGTE